MNAVVLNAPHEISVEKRKRPGIANSKDALVKVIVAGICGSELHPYRGQQNTTYGHVMGHEFTGIVEEVGSEVKSFKSGQHVVGTFSTACLSCWFCRYGHTNRCVNSLALGTQQIDGGQAEHVRVPNADGTLLLAPDDIDDELLVLMSDIFPTGYYGAMRAITQFRQPGEGVPETKLFEKQPLSEAVFVVVGCGIVGLCAVLTAHIRGVQSVYCVDSVDDRLEQAAKMGGIPLKLGRDDIPAIVRAATDGRGADAVIESVGNKAALRSAFDLLRPCGILSSVGFHQSELPFTGLECYQKNLSINFGRAPVRAVFEEAMHFFVENKSRFSEVISHRLSLAEAAKGYAIFDKQEARKVVLKP
ncbi:Uncharacterized protein BP5553_09779 [Venustampulla echinocandica]|uniref:GroES-like protein n=1 Tax=Venustampulla echinocandica TaxID=2656787 RepID=A0A370TAN0_9HELO|nr:Uncharacterized protein BP5553_09779 [Venustampulla echinocandica]RDL30990.1 Uncharacterized protein BP5553_09779 [Venustampulla echinocandica]